MKTAKQIDRERDLNIIEHFSTRKILMALIEMFDKWILNFSIAGRVRQELSSEWWDEQLSDEFISVLFNKSLSRLNKCKLCGEKYRSSQYRHHIYNSCSVALECYQNNTSMEGFKRDLAFKAGLNHELLQKLF